MMMSMASATPCVCRGRERGSSLLQRRRASRRGGRAALPRRGGGGVEAGEAKKRVVLAGSGSDVDGKYALWGDVGARLLTLTSVSPNDTTERTTTTTTTTTTASAAVSTAAAAMVAVCVAALAPAGAALAESEFYIEDIPQGLSSGESVRESRGPSLATLVKARSFVYVSLVHSLDLWWRRLT